MVTSTSQPVHVGEKEGAEVDAGSGGTGVAADPGPGGTGVDSAGTGVAADPGPPGPGGMGVDAG